MNARRTEPGPSPTQDRGPRPPNPLSKVAAATGIFSYAIAELWGHRVMLLAVPVGAVAVAVGIAALLRVKRIHAENGGLAFLGVVAGAVGILISVISRNPLL
jgi:hypothetical protein